MTILFSVHIFMFIVFLLLFVFIVSAFNNLLEDLIYVFYDTHSQHILFIRYLPLYRTILHAPTARNYPQILFVLQQLYVNFTKAYEIDGKLVIRRTTRYLSAESLDYIVNQQRNIIIICFAIYCTYHYVHLLHHLTKLSSSRLNYTKYSI